MSEKRELLKISELARRAGVNRGTIQHYLREGLLPKPVKTHRNMAFYDAGSVDRIRLIKKLQKQRFLPLSVIRKMVSGRSGGAQLKAVVEAQHAALDSLAVGEQSTTVSVEAASRVFDLPAPVLRQLEKLGFVAAHEKGGVRTFSGADAEVLAAVGQLRSLGITERAGFHPKDMLMYKKTLEELLNLEVETFVRVVVGNKPPEEAARLARASIMGATTLIVALRKKLIADFLGAAGPSRLEKGAAASEPSSDASPPAVDAAAGKQPRAAGRRARRTS